MCIVRGESEVKVKSLSHVRLFAIPWTVACKAPLSMRFSRQESWSKLPFPTPEDLSDLSPAYLALQENFLPAEPPEYLEIGRAHV